MEHDIRAYAATLNTWPRRLWLIGKRLIDMVGASLGLLILSPLLALLMVVIRLESPGPALFVQPRLGHYGRIFMMYKFRSMQHQAPLELNADGSTRVVSHDPRVTRLGHIMRRTGIDELPQLLNVLRGDMSLIGPRPDPAFYAANYTGTDWHKLALRPGITALAQALGRQTIGWRERFVIERRYVEHTSPLFDLLVLVLTLVVICRGTGVTCSCTTAEHSELLPRWLRRIRSIGYPRVAPVPRTVYVLRSGLMLALIGALLMLPVGLLTAQARQNEHPGHPLLEYVVIKSDGTHMAAFGYLQKDDVTVIVPTDDPKVGHE
jgi:lipopolysaccharide/colanic/teichoic acid biosynthesis glycosyltransferase